MKKACMVVWTDMVHDARVSKEAESVADSGYDVTVFGIHVEGKTKKTERKNGFLIKRLTKTEIPFIERKKKNRNIFDIAILIMLRMVDQVKIIKKAYSENADIYHAHDINVLPAVWLAAKLRKKPIIYDAHELSTSREGYKSIAGFIKRLESFLIKRVNGVIATTDMRADVMANDYAIDKPLVIQNMPEYYKAEKKDVIRDTYNIPANSKIILYQGGLQVGRGLDRILDVAALVCDAYFVFVGAGNLKASLIDKSEEKGISDRVIFIDAVPFEELVDFTCSADLGIHLLENTCLNHYTTDSNKLFEYIMAGLPLVISDFPEIRKVVEKYKVGELVDPENLDNVKYAILAITEDDNRRRYFSNNALSAAKELNWAVQDKKLKALYASIIG